MLVTPTSGGQGKGTCPVPEIRMDTANGLQSHFSLLSSFRLVSTWHPE